MLIFSSSRVFTKWLICKISWKITQNYKRFLLVGENLAWIGLSIWDGRLRSRYLLIVSFFLSHLPTKQALARWVRPAVWPRQVIDRLLGKSFARTHTGFRVVEPSFLGQKPEPPSSNVSLLCLQVRIGSEHTSGGKYVGSTAWSKFAQCATSAIRPESRVRILIVSDQSSARAAMLENLKGQDVV